MGASLWRCALRTPPLSLLARQSLYLLVTGSLKLACLTGPAFGRLQRHRRLKVVEL